MKTINKQLTATWTWLSVEPARLQLAVLLIAALAALALAVLVSSSHLVPIAGYSGGGSGGSG